MAEKFSKKDNPGKKKDDGRKRGWGVYSETVLEANKDKRIPQNVWLPPFPLSESNQKCTNAESKESGDGKGSLRETAEGCDTPTEEELYARHKESRLAETAEDTGPLSEGIMPSSPSTANQQELSDSIQRIRCLAEEDDLHIDGGAGGDGGHMDSDVMDGDTGPFSPEDPGLEILPPPGSEQGREYVCTLAVGDFFHVESLSLHGIFEGIEDGTAKFSITLTEEGGSVDGPYPLELEEGGIASMDIGHKDAKLTVECEAMMEHRRPEEAEHEIPEEAMKLISEMVMSKPFYFRKQIRELRQSREDTDADFIRVRISVDYHQ